MTAYATEPSKALERLDPSHPHAWITPVKRINEGHDVSDFLASMAYRDIMTFLLQLNHCMFPHENAGSIIQWTSNSPHMNPKGTVLDLQALLRKLHAMIDEAPPDTGPRRFGNISFRTWNRLLEERVDGLLAQYLPQISRRFAGDSNIDPFSELRAYLLGSFGSSQRLDYGTGHELSFLAFLGSIWKLGGFQTSEDGSSERSIVLSVIEPCVEHDANSQQCQIFANLPGTSYLMLVRRLIKTYTLEPAGSHGVWGLDDHSFLPYIFGSAQYAPPIQRGQVPMEGSQSEAPDPDVVTNFSMVEQERPKNMYFSAIGFIYDVKTGPFWEHSPTLYDISGVKAGWAKINKGMIKMYNAEVLSKFPVIQHFPFGSLFSFAKDPVAVSASPSPHIASHPRASSQTVGSLQATEATSPASNTSMKAPWAKIRGTCTTSGNGVHAPRGSQRSLRNLGSDATHEKHTSPRHVLEPTGHQRAMQSNTQGGDSETGGLPAVPLENTKAPWGS